MIMYVYRPYGCAMRNVYLCTAMSYSLWVGNWTTSLQALTCNCSRLPNDKSTYRLLLASTIHSRHALKLPQVRIAIEEEWAAAPPQPPWASIVETCFSDGLVVATHLAMSSPLTLRAPVKELIDDVDEQIRLRANIHVDLRKHARHPQHSKNSGAGEGSVCSMVVCNLDSKSILRC